MSTPAGAAEQGVIPEVINTVSVIGRVIGDLEPGYTAAGQAYCGFWLSITPRMVLLRSPEAAEEPDQDRLRCVAFGRIAERFQESVGQGDSIAIAGFLGTRKFTCACGSASHPMEIVVEGFASLMHDRG